MPSNPRLSSSAETSVMQGWTPCLNCNQIGPSIQAVSKSGSVLMSSESRILRIAATFAAPRRSAPKCRRKSRTVIRFTRCPAFNRWAANSIFAGTSIIIRQSKIRLRRHARSSQHVSTLYARVRGARHTPTDPAPETSAAVLELIQPGRLRAESGCLRV